MSRARRHGLSDVVAALSLVIVVGCGSPAPSPLGPPATLAGSQPSAGAQSSSGDDLPAFPSPPPDAGRKPLPQDVVRAIDAIVGATSPEGAIAATQVVLERSGVVVTDDPASATKSMAGLYVSPAQLATMAHEAQSRGGVSHVNFAQFAETFAGLALLPPNDRLLDLLADPQATPDPASSERTEIDMDGQAGRLAGVMTSWVNRSLDNHPSDDPTMTALTAPALYLAELASRQDEPVDLREPFLPSQFQLGSLDVTLLAAGLRTILAVAGQTNASDSRPLMAAAASGWDTAAGALAGLEPTGCGEVKRILDAQAPLIVEVFSFGAGEAIKAFVESSVADIFESAADFAKGIGAAFEAIGVLFRVQALWLMYHNTELTLKFLPTSIHKPVGANERVAAMLTAGIPDAKWAQAIADRNNSPAASHLKACARLLGIPVTSDLIDVGEATSSWRVSWDITQGDAHAQFEGCQFIPSCDPRAVAAGRLERSLAKNNDHSGKDLVIVEIKPEKETDHPGREVSERVRVCAHLRTDKPPDVATILNAGSAGVSGVTVGGVASLASSVANILLSWWQFVFTIDKCANTTVNFHVPQTGNWRGTVKINYELHESSRITSARFKGSYRTSLDMTDTIYLAGDDHGEVPVGQSQVYVSLDARQYTRGGFVREDVEHRLVYGYSGCAWIEDTTLSMSGPINYAMDAIGSLTIEADGRYRLSAHRQVPDEEITLPHDWTQVITDNGSVEGCVGFGTETDGGDLPVIGAPESLEMKGQMDLTSPTQRLKGRVTSTDYLGGITSVEWDLTREPVPAPSPQ
ncbi:MAG: hypothetical protein WD830_00245 [Chloroflexota bacterium]